MDGVHAVSHSEAIEGYSGRPALRSRPRQAQKAQNMQKTQKKQYSVAKSAHQLARARWYVSHQLPPDEKKERKYVLWLFGSLSFLFFSFFSFGVSEGCSRWTNRKLHTLFPLFYREEGKNEWSKMRADRNGQEQTDTRVAPSNSRSSIVAAYQVPSCHLSLLFPYGSYFSIFAELLC